MQDPWGGRRIRPRGLSSSRRGSSECCDAEQCRQYLHADVEQAAGDLAYVLFDLYALDVTTPLFQTAASFEGCACWYERGVAFETLIYPRPLGNEGCPRCRKTRRDA